MTDHAPRRLVILEATPSLTVTGWTLHSGAAYKATISNRAATSNLYRRVVGVRQNNTDLVAAASAAAVVSTVGSWFWDEAAALLYVRANVTNFLPLNQTSRAWSAMAATPSGNIYACDIVGGKTWMQTGGEGNFVAVGFTAQFYGMAAAPNGDVYGCVYGGDIYKQTGGSGAFNALSQTTRNWNGMTAAANGDVYAAVAGGDIYKQTGGAGNFIALSQTSRQWNGMAVSAAGDVYACVSSGDIYKQTGGAGNFIALSQTSRFWRGMAAVASGDVYACVDTGDIYKQTGGTGNFVALSQTSRRWYAMAGAPDGAVYACVMHANAGEPASDIYKQYNDPFNSTMQALVTYCFATEGVVINRLAGDPSTGIFYEPSVLDGLPTLTRQVSDLLFGITVVPSGSVSFANGDGAWHSLIPDHNWRYKKVRILSAEYSEGAAVPDRPSFLPVMTLQVEDVSANDETAELSLVGLQSSLEKVLPPSVFTVEKYLNLGQGVAGTRKWLGWGRATIRPDLTNNTGNGVYTVADAAYQTLFAVNAVVAIHRTTGVRTTLTLTTHYTVNLTSCTITIVSATYIWSDYIIECDVTGKPDGGGSYLKKFGEIVKDILQTHLGVLTADIDATSFSTVASYATQELAVWIKEPRSIASLFASSESEKASLEKSVLGTIRQTPAGLWNVRVRGDATPASSVVLTQNDFVSFNTEPRVEAAVSGLTVFYGRNHSLETWGASYGVDNEFKYLSEAYGETEIYTFLKDAADAEALVTKALPLITSRDIEAEFELRGAALAQEMAGDFITVSYAPAPVAGQALVAVLLQIARLDISLSPSLKLAGRLKQFPA